MYNPQPEQPYTADIDALIKEMEHYKVNLNDPSLGSGFWDQAVKDFMIRHSGKIISLLEELGKSRRKAFLSLPADNLHRVIIQAHADGGPSNALSAAMNKATLYFSDQHDIIIILQDILELPEGGHCTTMEVHIVPPTLKDGVANDKQQKGLKHIHDHDYGKKHNEGQVKYPVFNYLSGTADDGPMDLPDYILVNVHDPSLMNYMIEKKFFDAGHLFWPVATDGTPPMKQMMVRMRHPRMELAS